MTKQYTAEELKKMNKEEVISRLARFFISSQPRTFFAICQAFFHIFSKKYPAPFFGYEVFFSVILT